MGKEGGSNQLSAIKLEKITKSFPGIIANDCVDFELDYGEVHALVGENGAGKTTLMRILRGFYSPDSGKMIINGEECDRLTLDDSNNKGIAMVHQHFMQVDSLSVVENIIVGKEPKKGPGIVDYKTATKKVEELLESMNMKINPKTPIGKLSMGERQKVEIIKLLYAGADILIFDEPTAVLTPQEAQDLFVIINRLKSEGKAIVYISHKLNEVIEIADRATVMRKGKVVAYFPDKDSMTVNKLAASMVGVSDFKMVTNETVDARENKKIISLKDVWYVDPDTQVNLISDLSMDVHEGEILGICGVEGNGQRELAYLILGLYQQNAGTIEWEGEEVSKESVHKRRSRGIGYISDDRMNTGISKDSSLQDNVICGRSDAPEFSTKSVLRKKSIDQVTSQIIKDFDVYGASLGIPIKQLSGGNIQKMILGRELHSNPKLLIAAHPTRGLDVHAINFVREQLIKQRDEGAGVLLISADLDELFALSDRILVMYEGQFTGEITDIANTTEEQVGLLMGGIRQEEIESMRKENE